MTIAELIEHAKVCFKNNDYEQAKPYLKTLASYYRKQQKHKHVVIYLFSLSVCSLHTGKLQLAHVFAKHCLHTLKKTPRTWSGRPEAMQALSKQVERISVYRLAAAMEIPDDFTFTPEEPTRTSASAPPRRPSPLSLAGHGG